MGAEIINSTRRLILFNILIAFGNIELALVNINILSARLSTVRRNIVYINIGRILPNSGGFRIVLSQDGGRGRGKA